ncbi:MAG: serine/threonine protein kinase [Acidobacteria bacterium]|nr:serine/threonine protein kinase [Acidobacteriota bacterium]
MTAERWRQVEELFHEAAALAPAELGPWLSGRCTGDEDLEREVRKLLAADRGEGGTIERRIGESVTEWLDRPAPGAPERVGPWRIVKPLGTGGMGAVYLAARDDDSYRQLAAVKVLRPEQFGPGIRERFRQERQILAELEHPNIARLLDGGTTSDGRPYIVLEYVDGVPLTEFVNRLSLNERCALFATVCDAVAYAHRNLIVHRDLKPANILVDAQGTPKLLDFGIAKLLGVDNSMTASMHALFTPDYASPEQIAGQSITTATDVYALGAVFYEVLTGRPVRSTANRSFAELVRDVTDGDIPLPSRAATMRIPADLDRIVEKALAREPERRYGTADQLAADLRRFLNGLPVEARGYSWVYAARKFARRHWLPISALTALVCGLAAGTVWSVRQAQIAAQARTFAERERDRAEQERARAEAALAESSRQKTIAEHNAEEAAVQRASALDRFHSARKLTHKFLFDIEDSLKDTVGTTKARQVLVATALEHFEQMGREVENDPALIRDLARAYDRIGDLQGYTGTANLGDFAGAVSSYRKSLEWHRKVWADPEVRLFAGGTTTKLAKTLKWIGRIPEAETSFASAAGMFANLQSSLPAGQRLVLVRYRSNLNRAWGEHMQVRDQHEKARELLTASVADLRQAITLEPGDASLRRALSADCVALSRSLVALQEWPEALRVADLSLSVIREVIGPKPAIRDQARLIPPGIQLADVLHHAPVPIVNIPRALTIDEELLAIADKLVAADAANDRNQFLLSSVLSRYAEHLRAEWRWPDAKAAYERTIAVGSALLKAAPANGYYQDMVGTDMIFEGLLLFDMHEDDAAVSRLARGLEILEKSVAAGRLFNATNVQIAKECLAEIARERSVRP